MRESSLSAILGNIGQEFDDAHLHADLLAYLHDSPDHHPDDYTPYWHDDAYCPTAEAEAWWCGFGIGYGNLDAGPPAEYDTANRAAWRTGYDAGYDVFLDAIEPEDWESMYADELAERYHPEETIRALGVIDARKVGR
jgi:hypothetical protein